MTRAEQRDLHPRGCGVAAAEGLFAPSHTWAAAASPMNGAGLAAPPRPRGGLRPTPVGRAPRPPHASPAPDQGGHGRLNQRLTGRSADHFAEVGKMVWPKAAKGPQRGQTGHRPHHMVPNQAPATKLSPLVRELQPFPDPSSRGGTPSAADEAISRSHEIASGHSNNERAFAMTAPPTGLEPVAFEFGPMEHLASNQGVGSSNPEDNHAA